MSLLNMFLMFKKKLDLVLQYTVLFCECLLLLKIIICSIGGEAFYLYVGQHLLLNLFVFCFCLMKQFCHHTSKGLPMVSSINYFPSMAKEDGEMMRLVRKENKETRPFWALYLNCANKCLPLPQTFLFYFLFSPVLLEPTEEESPQKLDFIYGVQKSTSKNQNPAFLTPLNQLKLASVVGEEGTLPLPLPWLLGNLNLFVH